MNARPARKTVNKVNCERVATIFEGYGQHKVFISNRVPLLEGDSNGTAPPNGISESTHIV